MNSKAINIGTNLEPVYQDDRELLFELGKDMDMIMEVDPGTLYLKAEVLFYEFLRVANLALSEDDYRENFRPLFAAFMRGELMEIATANSLSDWLEKCLHDLHADAVSSPKANVLYLHCQVFIIAYLIRTGQIETDLAYDDMGFSDVFELLSTGALTMPKSERKVEFTAFPEPPEPASASHSINSGRALTRSRIAATA